MFLFSIQAMKQHKAPAKRDCQDICLDQPKQRIVLDMLTYVHTHNEKTGRLTKWRPIKC